MFWYDCSLEGPPDCLATTRVQVVDGDHRVFPRTEPLMGRVTVWRRNRIALVSCVASKGASTLRAEELYQSNWFRHARALARSAFDSWFILSAKHGLLNPSQVIAPYDLALRDLDDEESKVWAALVADKLSKTIGRPSEVMLLAGSDYRSKLAPLLEALGHTTVAPMSRMGIGSQIAWLKHMSATPNRLRDAFRLRDALSSLLPAGSPAPRLRDLSAADVPRSGVYFFFDDSEGASIWHPFGRLVRVGTHAVSTGSKATLWQRLRTHRGADDGRGNHRASIFRLHVGRALIRDGLLDVSSWGEGQAASASIIHQELELERAVSRHIGELRVMTIAVADAPGPQSDRAYIEQCSIGLLTGVRSPVAPPSRSWLGLSSDRSTIRESGLWNVNHVFGAYDPRFLDCIEDHVVRQSRGESVPFSIAPADWRAELARLGRQGEQMSLL